MNAPAPLDEEQLRVLGETRTLSRKLRFARGVAFANVISLGAGSAISILSGVFGGSFSIFGVLLGALAWNESRGRSELAAAEPRGTRRLALNQLALLALVLVYCGHSAYLASSGPDPLQALAGQSAEVADVLKELQSQGGQDLDTLGGWVQTGALIGYAVVAALSALVQGLTAFYYSSLRGTVEALARAPAWARALQ
jgi:hypothetical protein